MSKKQSHENILNLCDFRKKKEIDTDIAPGRTPLYVSHLNGKVTGNPNFKRPSNEDFGDRLQRIRHSLEKINSLMNELKKQSSKNQEKSNRT